MADMVASVPELTNRTFSIRGNAESTNSASSGSSGLDAPKLVPLRAAAITASTTSGAAWPRISGPQEPRYSMYSLPSASQMREPSPRTIKGGSPPTARKARTGESTPPGITASARFCSLRDCSVLRPTLSSQQVTIATPATPICDPHHSWEKGAKESWRPLAKIRAHDLNQLL